MDGDGFAVPTSRPSKGKQRAEDEVDAVDHLDEANEEYLGELVNDPEIQKLLDEAEDLDVPELTAHALKKLIVQLERRINANDDMRIKYPNKPEKFMETEEQLHVAIKNLHQLSTAPALIPEFVRLNAVTSVLGLLGHDNTDIANDVVEFLQEMTEGDTLGESVECSELLVEALLENDLCGKLMRNVLRLNEKKRDEADGVYNTLSIIENLTEASPQFADIIGQKTEIIAWLLKRVQTSGSDANKLYASEILAILLQNNPQNQKIFGKKNGVLSVLTVLSHFKKRDPTSIEEEETVENLYDCISSALMQDANKGKFLTEDGIELMLLVVKAGKFARQCAVKVLGFALKDFPEGCNRLVESLGLRTMFAAFMKKGLKHLSHKKKKAFMEDEFEEHVLSCLFSLLMCTSPASRYLRVIYKFCENDFEKIDRLMELLLKYRSKVASFEEKLVSGEDTLVDLLDSEEELYARRLEAGLFTLQLVSLILVHLAATQECSTATTSASSHIEQMLQLHDVEKKDVAGIVQEFLYYYEPEEDKGRLKQQKQIVDNLKSFLGIEEEASAALVKQDQIPQDKESESRREQEEEETDEREENAENVEIAETGSSSSKRKSASKREHGREEGGGANERSRKKLRDRDNDEGREKEEPPRKKLRGESCK